MSQQTHYASVQAIREGAGLLKRVQNEKPSSGAINGSNTVFVVKRRPIVDSNYDDVVGKEDVIAYVDGAVVAVASVNAAAGQVTLSSAPANGTTVLFDYCYSPISDDYVATKQEESDSWIDLKLKGWVATPVVNPPGIIKTAAELYAAGLILTRDWGSRVDSEQTSKDGYAKFKQARALLDDYIMGIKKDRETKGANDRTMVGITDGDVFKRDPTDNNISPDDLFMRNPGADCSDEVL